MVYMNAPVNQALFILHFIQALRKELLLNKGKVLLCFAIVSLSVVSYGLIFPKKYETSTTLYADQQNIIRPLLAGKAAITKVQDQSKIVKEVIYSPRILNKVVVDAKLLRGTETPAQIEAITNGLRSKIIVKNIGSNFIRLTYSSSLPDVTYDVLTSVSDRFIKDTSERKRKESREAFQFISAQVATYKRQLQDADIKLKEFKSTNIDGSEASVKTRISTMQAKLEEMKLDIDDAQIRLNSLKSELKAENQFINKRFRSEVYIEQIRNKQKTLDILRLTYTDTYPDVISIRLQIEDLQRTLASIDDIADSNGINAAQKNSNINPLYEELRSKLSMAKVELATQLRRQQGTERLLLGEQERLKRIAARQADLSELTRDYEVTKSIYEGMLGRKETARLSMTLDIEGQGVKYKIQEPAAYPLTPKGVRFFHFALAGPVLGILAPIGMLIAFIFLDPRIRFVEKITMNISVPVLGVVPHIHTSLSKRIFKTDIILLGVFALITMAAYISIILARLNGII